MRSFLQKKANATYFSGSSVTVSIRKNNMEYIFALQGGWHAVVSLIPTPEGAVMMACLGNISGDLDHIIPTLVLKPGEHTKFTDILEGKSAYQLLTLETDGKGPESGIGTKIKGLCKPHLQLLGDPEIQREAEKLCTLTLNIYSDLSTSPYPSLKSLTKHFYD